MTPLVLWIAGSLLVGYFGRHRRIGVLGFFICSMLFSPPLCLVVLVLTAPAPAKTPASR